MGQFDGLYLNIYVAELLHNLHKDFKEYAETIYHEIMLRIIIR